MFISAKQATATAMNATAMNATASSRHPLHEAVSERQPSIGVLGLMS